MYTGGWLFGISETSTVFFCRFFLANVEALNPLQTF